MEDGIAVAYLLRGKDTNWQDCCNRFLYSYQQYAAGCDHELHIIIKGFECPEDELRARQIIAPLECHVSSVADDAFDIGAYREWSKGIKNTVICLMNTGSEILADHWLQKLHGNFLDPSVRIVSVDVSYNRNRPGPSRRECDNLSCTSRTTHHSIPSRYRNQAVRLVSRIS